MSKWFINIGIIFILKNIDLDVSNFKLIFNMNLALTLIKLFRFIIN